MGRKAVEGERRTEQVLVRFTKDGVEAIDSMRGEMNRSEFIRHLVKRERARRWKAR